MPYESDEKKGMNGNELLIMAKFDFFRTSPGPIHYTKKRDDFFWENNFILAPLFSFFWISTWHIRGRELGDETLVKNKYLYPLFGTVFERKKVEIVKKIFKKYRVNKLGIRGFGHYSHP